MVVTTCRLRCACTILDCAEETNTPTTNSTCSARRTDKAAMPSSQAVEVSMECGLAWPTPTICRQSRKLAECCRARKRGILSLHRTPKGEHHALRERAIRATWGVQLLRKHSPGRAKAIASRSQGAHCFIPCHAPIDGARLQRDVSPTCARRDAGAPPRHRFVRSLRRLGRNAMTPLRCERIKGQKTRWALDVRRRDWASDTCSPRK